MSNNTTMIRVSKTTKEKLELLKNVYNDGSSLGDVVNNLLPGAFEPYPYTKDGLITSGCIVEDRGEKALVRGITGIAVLLIKLDTGTMYELDRYGEAVYNLTLLERGADI